MKSQKKTSRNKISDFKSFTLIEILVVATIIALLTSGGAVVYTQLNRASRDAKRKTDLEQIRAALEMYRSNNNQYYSGSFNNNCQNVNWLGSYLSSLPNDPKSPSYYYRCNITQSDYTLGAYLETGGTGSCGTCGSANCNYCVGPYGQK
jgi:prepilin-type N-terminal cleavage/methylation domain